MEKHWYQTLDWSMIWVCLFSIIALLLYMEVYGQKEVIQGKTGEVLRNNKWVKALYHLVAGFVMLSFVSEIGFDNIKPFLGLSLEAENNVAHLLAFISGISGGYVIAKIIRLAQKKLN